MNSNSPVATGAAAISGAMLGGVIVWFCSVVHVAAPPADVAGTLGAVVLIGGHYAVNWLNRRFPAPAPTTIAASAAPNSAPGTQAAA